MIFRPDHAGKILTGHKTQHRLHADHHPKPDIGDAHNVQAGRGKAKLARIEILDVGEQLLRDIRHTDARAEGFANVDELHAHWRERYRDGPLLTDPPVNCWVITFKRVPLVEPPRLLAPTGVQGGTARHYTDETARGYATDTQHAMDREPEAVGESVVDEFAKENQVRHERRQMRPYLQREKLSLERRLELVRREAKESGLNLSRSLRVIERQLKEAERKLARKRAA